MVRLPGKPQSELDKEIAKEDVEYFSFQLNEARESGRYPLHVAAKLIAQAAGVFTSEATMEKRLILAAHEGSLPVYTYGETARERGPIPFFGTVEAYWDDLNNWLAINEPRIGRIFQNPVTPAANAQTETQTTLPAEKVEVVPVMPTQTPYPWNIKDSRDPKPEQPWYTPARYFARQLVREDSTLLTKRNTLANKVVQSLTNAGIKKRGGKKPFDPGTIKKALSNIDLG